MAANQEQDKLKLSPNARVVLESRYLQKDPAGNIIESPAQLFHRVAAAVARAESTWSSDPAVPQRWQQRFYDLMADRLFLPNSPTLMNAGRPLGMLSACFVLPLPDSIDGIFDTVKATALIQKAGGGTGFSLDLLRPAGDHIASSGGQTSGPLSFWKVLSETTNAIQQGAFPFGVRASAYFSPNKSPKRQRAGFLSLLPSAAQLPTRPYKPYPDVCCSVFFNN